MLGPFRLFVYACVCAAILDKLSCLFLFARLRVGDLGHVPVQFIQSANGESKQKGNDLELKQSHPTSHPQYQKGKNDTQNKFDQRPQKTRTVLAE